MFGVIDLMYETFCPFEYYKVDEMLAEFGLSVNSKYRGRNVGFQLLATRQKLCEAFDLELTHNAFSSEYSSACADKVGFDTNVVMK